MLSQGMGGTVRPHLLKEIRVFGLVYHASLFALTEWCGHGCFLYLRREAIALINALTVAPSSFVISKRLL